MKQISIPSGVTIIKEYTFSVCSSLVHVSFHPWLKVIKEFAFDECTALTQVVIPSSVKTIENYAFCQCSSLFRVSFNSPLVGIGKNAFIGCPLLTIKEITAFTNAQIKQNYEKCNDSWQYWLLIMNLFFLLIYNYMKYFIL